MWTREERDELLQALRELTGRPDPAQFDRFRAGLPGALYIGRDDRLQVSAWNLTAALRLVLRARLMQPSGEVVPQRFEFAPLTTGAASRSRFDLGEGFLLSATVQADGAGATDADTFVELAITRGGEPVPEPVQVLARGYLESTGLVGFPWGPMRYQAEGPGEDLAQTFTDPAAGAEVSEALAANQALGLQSLVFTLVTSAVVGNRQVRLELVRGATVYFRVTSSVVQAASLTRVYVAAAFGADRALTNDEIWLPLPPRLTLVGGDTVRTVTAALDVGDNYGAPVAHFDRWVRE